MKKEDLIPGRWYEFKNKGYLPFKFLKYDDEFIYADCYIDGKYRSGVGKHCYCTDMDKIFESDMADIIVYLPKNHPDLIQNKTYELW